MGQPIALGIRPRNKRGIGLIAANLLVFALGAALLWAAYYLATTQFTADMIPALGALIALCILATSVGITLIMLGVHHIAVGKWPP